MLELEDIAKIYGVKVIFKKVSCRLPAGSVSLLVGPNGAGKSTLMRIMAGLSRPTMGSVQLAEGTQVGYLGHATLLYPGITALANLAFWNSAYGLMLSDNALMSTLERVGLEAHAHDRAGIFSRGMAQRLNLARLLMQSPDLLLLDEPGTGLAQQRGACVVLISHDLQGDAPLADRLLVLTECTLQYDGPPFDYPSLTAANTEGNQACYA